MYHIINSNFKHIKFKVLSGLDTRTTLMIKNIPNKYLKQDILNDINCHNFYGYYDFFYLIPDLSVIYKYYTYFT